MILRGAKTLISRADIAAIVLTGAGVLSAASFQGGGVSPGLIVTIFGQKIGPDPLVSATVGADLKFPTTVAETRVLFNGVPAPLIYVFSLTNHSELEALCQHWRDLSYEVAPAADWMAAWRQQGISVG